MRPARDRRSIRTSFDGLNAELPYIWLYHNVWGLAASDKVGGLSTPEKLGFARQDAKPWWPQIWLKQ